MASSPNERHFTTNSRVLVQVVPGCGCVHLISRGCLGHVRYCRSVWCYATCSTSARCAGLRGSRGGLAYVPRSRQSRDLTSPITRRYCPTLLHYAIALRYHPTLSPYAITLRAPYAAIALRAPSAESGTDLPGYNTTTGRKRYYGYKRRGHHA
eukprot:1160725-Rhodomonas_salina.2